MAITLGTPSSSGNQTTSSSFSFNHTTETNTKALVVVVTGVDTSDTDSAVSSITFDSVALSHPVTRYRISSAFIDIWYLPNPAIASTKAIAVTMGGTCTDVQATAVNLIDSSADTIYYDNNDSGSGSGSASAIVNPAVTGSVAVGGGFAVGGDPTLLSVTAGAEVSGSEVDMGSQTASVGTASESGGSATITWAYTGVNNAAFAATFYPIATTITLEDPTAGETVTDTTPDLTFHGHTTNKTTTNNIEYQLQVDTNSSFNSTPNTITADYYSESNQTGALGISGGTGYYDSRAQSFTGNGGTLTSCKFNMKKVLLPTGNAVVKIYAHTGTWGSSGVPTGAALATSDNFDVQGLNTSDELKSFTFSGGNQITLTNGVRYIVSVEYSGGDNSNYITVGYNNVGTGHGGNASYSADLSTWIAAGTWDLCFYVYTTDNGPLISSLSTDALGDFEAGHPWDDAEVVTYTVQSALTTGTKYWRVRGKDVATGVWGAWSTGAGSGYESFVVSSGAEANVFDSVNVSENITIQPANLVLNIYDQVNVSENITSQANPQSLSVYDIVNVSEDLTISEYTPVVDLNIDVFDLINVSENIVSQVPTEFVNVNDNINTSEDIVIIEAELKVNVFDPVFVSEAVTSQENSYNIDVYDLVTANENLTVIEKNLVLSVFDTINISEAITSQASPQTVSVFDNLEVSEIVVILIPTLFASIFDSVQVSENITAEQNSYNINVFDSVVESEAVISQALPQNIDVFDDVTTAEDIAILENNLIISVFDSVTAAENITIEEITAITDLSIDVYDLVNVSESTILSEVFRVSVWNLQNVSEDITSQAYPLTIDVNDSVNVSEDIIASAPPASTLEVNVNDVVNISEDIVSSKVLRISVWNLQNLSEDITSQANPQSLNVFDSISVSEDITTSESSPTSLDINVSDNVTVTGSVTASEIIRISVWNIQNVSENITANTSSISTLSVFDSVSVQDDLGQAFSFDGATEYVQITDSTSVRPETNNAFSVSFRFKVNTYFKNILPRIWEKRSIYLAIMGDPTSSRYGKLGLEVQNSVQTSPDGHTEYWGSTKLQLDKWYTAVVIFDGSLATNQASMYLNGVAETVGIIFPWEEWLGQQLQDTSGIDFYIARSRTNLSRCFDGVIDEFTFYNRALTSDEALDISAGSEPPTNGLGLYLKMNDLTTDSSGNGNTVNSVVTQVPSSTPLYVDVQIQGEKKVIDGVLVSESVTVVISSLKINVSDNVNVSEDITAFQGNLVPSVSDDATVSENITIQENSYNVNVSDNVTATEDITASIISPGTLDISVFDSVNASENISSQEPIDYLSVFDSVSITDSLIISIPLEPLNVSLDTEIWGIQLVT